MPKPYPDIVFIFLRIAQLYIVDTNMVSLVVNPNMFGGKANEIIERYKW